MLIAYLSGWLVPPVITIFALFFPTADFTLRSMKLRKKIKKMFPILLPPESNRAPSAIHVEEHSE